MTRGRVPSSHDSASTKVRPEDLGRFSEITSVVLSHDGARVAVAVSRPDVALNSYERTIFLGVIGDHSVLAPLRPAGGCPEIIPRWSPANDGLATVRLTGATSEIWLYRDGAHPVFIASSPDPIEELSWSPDGTHLLFVARQRLDREWWQTPEPARPPLRVDRLRYREDGLGWTFNRPRQGFVVGAHKGADVVQISTGGFDDTEFSWHPNGQSVAFVSQREQGSDRSIENDLYVQDLRGSADAERLTRTEHCYGQPSFSLDGETIAMTAVDVANFPSVSTVVTIPARGGKVTLISPQLDRDCNSASSMMRRPIWLDDHSLAVLVEDAGAVHAYELDASGVSSPVRVIEGFRRISSLDVRDSTWVYVSQSPVEPPRLLCRTSGGDELVLFDPHQSATSERSLRGVAHRRVRVSAETEIDSWLSFPEFRDSNASVPLLVCMQGGGTQYGWQFSHEFQTLLGAGFAVLTCNPRGSAGYGNAWQRSVAGPNAAHPGSGWGGVDIADVVATLDATLERESSLDASRVGVLGGSYGALVTTWLLATTDKFAAGWAERGPYNLFSLAGTNDESPWFFETYLGRSVVEDPTAYWIPSPLRLVSGITVPLALVHSEEDRRCPIQQAEEMFMALKLLDRPVEMFRFPGEGHGLSRVGSPVHRVQRLELMVEWFSRWLDPQRDQVGRMQP